MKNLFDKACLASRIAAASIFIITVMAAPHALAQDAAAQRIKQLEQSLQAIQMELQKMKSENAQAAQKVNS
ncbi:MAG: porin family protein, partial [Pseudomonadota bacterium]